MKLPIFHKLGYTPPKGTLGNRHRSTIGRMPGDRTSRSIDAHHVISMRVLHFATLRCPATPDWLD
jgi:hypothetical protein